MRVSALPHFDIAAGKLAEHTRSQIWICIGRQNLWESYSMDGQRNNNLHVPKTLNLEISEQLHFALT